MKSNFSRDPSHDSSYVDDTLYDRLVALAMDWRSRTVIKRDERPNNEIAADCTALINAEARFADTLELESWIACYAPECIYWIPASCGGGDPRQEITHEIHDRRRLEDRIARIRTGFAYSMIPSVRATHVLGNFEIWSLEAKEVRARASFIIDAVNNDRRRVLSGWIGYSLVEIEHQWRIAVKQINLIDADQPQGNNSFFL